MNPLVPLEEVMMEPNRTHAERLFMLVKKQWVLTRDAWPMWARLVQKYGWPIVIKAADQCHPEKRYVNNVEAFCIELSKEQAAEAKEEAARAVNDTPVAKTPDEDRFAIWLPQYEAKGVYPVWFKRLAERLGRTLP